MGEVKIYTDYEFHGIDCMISEDKETLGFFKDSIDVRPSSATYIKKEDAEKLYKIFSEIIEESYLDGGTQYPSTDQFIK